MPRKLDYSGRRQFSNHNIGEKFRGIVQSKKERSQIQISNLCILFAIIVLGKNAPALTILYDDTQAIGMDARALATINALAVILNACVAALCGLSLAIIWRAIIRKVRWAFWSLSTCLIFLQIAGFASDSFLQHKDLVANSASSLCLLAGVTFAAIGVLRTSNPGT